MALPRFLAHNLGWKIASVFLATLIWVVVRGGSQTRLRPSGQHLFPQQPVAVLAAADDPRRFRVEPEAVAVRVTGPRDVVRQLLAQEVRAFVDMTAVLDAQHSQKRVLVLLPPGFTVTSVTPSEVVVQELPPTPAQP